MTIPSEGGTKERAVLKRLVSAAILIPLFVWAVLGASPWFFRFIVMAAAGAAAWELLGLFQRAGRSVYRWLGIVLTIGVTASFLVPGGSACALALATGLVLSAPLWTGRVPAGEAGALTLLAVTYIGWLLGHAMLTQALPYGGGLIVFLVGVTWAGESAAYLVGSLVGRHPLAPVISPRKTVEGSVAQAIVSTLTAWPLALWLLPTWSAGLAALAGLLLGVVGQIGDLVESAIKRSVSAKDASALIPGHGGVLDRLDGLLFNVPALYYYARWIGVGA